MSVLFDPHQIKRAGHQLVLRQSMIGTADTCHKRLEFDLNPNIPYFSGEARIQGTGYHAALEYWYDCAAKGFERPSMEGLMKCAREAFEHELRLCDPFEWDTSFEAVLENTERMLREYFGWERSIGTWGEWQQTLTPKHWDVDGPYTVGRYEVIATEWEFFLFMPGRRPGDILRPVKGAVDLVLLDRETGHHLLVDHKTSRKPWKKGKHTFRSTNQPPWYTHWWRQAWAMDHDGEVPPVVEFWFDIMGSDPAKPHWERREATATPLEMELVIGKANDVLDLIERGGPFMPNTSSFLCHHEYCDHWATCPYGEALG